MAKKTDAKKAGKSVLGKVSGALQKHGRDTYEFGFDTVKDLASRSIKSVSQHPWPYLGGAAIGFLTLGVLLGRSSK